MSVRRSVFWIALLLMSVAVACAIYGISEAQRDPVIRRATVRMPRWPEHASPLKILLISDVHVARPDMSPERLARIVARLNLAKPDAIFIAGDLVSDKMLSWRVEAQQAIAPLGGLRAPLGVYVVLGNHDHWRGVTRIRWALGRARIRLLNDEAIRLGPIILGGIDDSVTGHSDFEGTVRRMRALGPGPKLLLGHGTGYFAYLPDDVPLMLAGHDHCGQIRLPLPGWPQFRCGVEREGSKAIITGAGLGTSILPFRINAPPDAWLITLRD